MAICRENAEYLVLPASRRTDLDTNLTATREIYSPVDSYEHREIHAGDLARWGRRRGLATVRCYGTAWFSLLARRRWEKISSEALAEAFAVINGERS